MARKTKVVQVSSEGRDKGKNFLLTEMPVYKAEKWAARALIALSSVLGDSAPEPSEGLGGLANLKLSDFSRIPFELAEPLLDEMMECVKVLPDPGNPGNVRVLFPGSEDIEELSTMLTLRKEILGLHFDFFDLAGS